MRPRRLELEGFGTFRERTVVDFADLELVAFVGPTGSGKSTVIDALTFALYGSVPRYDNPNLVAPAIHQLAVEAKVRLDFELAGRTYTAVRVVRRVEARSGAKAGGPSAAPKEGRATTREARLERWEADGSTTVLAGNVKELDEAVKALIGLDFAQFTRTIVLPQGEFARFIKGSAAERQELLSQLLDLQILARMGAAARERAKEAAQRADTLTERSDRLAHATPEAIDQLGRELDALAQLEGQVEVALGEVEGIEAQLVERRRQVEQLDAALAGLAGLRVPDELARLDAELSAAAAGLDAAGAALDGARNEHAEARAALDQAGDRGEIDRLVARRRRQAELADEQAGLETELAAARTAQAEAAATTTAATSGAEAAAAALRTVRSGADAAAWVAQLAPGRPCPVCAQVVTTVPHHVTHEELTRAEAGALAADRALTAARTADARAEGRVQSLEADVAQRAKQVAALADELDGIGPLDALLAALAAATDAAGRAREAEQVLRRAEAAAAEADQRHRRVREAEQTWSRDYTTQRDSVAALGPPAPAPAGGSLLDSWTALVAWATAHQDALTAQRAEVAAAGKELAAAKATLLDTLAAAAGALGLADEPARLPVAIATRAATTRARQEQLTAEAAERADLAGQITAAARQRTLNEALGQHLAANRFEAWLLAEALDDIVARANGRLAELSNGRYSLEVVDRTFAVRDHGNADERRDIRTLSGGETFLASLALALALSASIAELAPVDAPRLESIFLDEGFGTLDAETLDVLASAIEELSAQGRLVAIVTHVRDLGERMPVRFEVRKGPVSSTIERIDG